jgi:PAS domain S-box-containing protein
MSNVLSKRLTFSFAAVAAFLIGTSAARYVALKHALDDSHEVASTREILRELDGLLSTLKDAETGQRGFIITGDPRYLDPFRKAGRSLERELARLGELVADDPAQRVRLEQLRKATDQQTAELQTTIELREQEGFEAAKAAVEQDRDRALMAQAGNVVDDMIADQEARLSAKQQQVRSTERFNMVCFYCLASINLLLVALLYNMVRIDAVKRLEAAALIERHEQRLRRVVESNVIGILFLDASGTAVDANDAFLQLVGYDAQDLKAGIVSRATISAPEFRARDELALAEVHRSGKCTPYEKEYVRHDGKRVPVLVGIARLDDAGSQYVAFVLDLSERRAAEEARARLAAIVESSDDAIISKGLDGTITTWNSGAVRLLGYTAAETIGQPVSIMLPPDRLDEERQLRERLSRGDRVEHYETVRVAKDGRRYDVALTSSLVHDESGRLIGIASIGRDITAHKQAELERERLLAAEQTARAEAERIGHVKDEFLATLSHELRTPLNSILGWAHLLTHGNAVSAETAQGLAIIERSARAQNQLIEDLLDMSRITSGKLRMDVQRVELATVIDAAIESVRPAAEAKQIRLQRVLDPNAGPVHGDPNRLQQVVWNLLSNAVKFTPKQGRVQVTLARVNSHVEVRVSDSGQGIAAEFLPHVFERFRQADSSSTRRYSGLGLGLAIARHLVESHGGAIGVTSSGEGHGSTFIVALPLMVLHAEEDMHNRVHPRTGRSGSNGTSKPDLRGVRVLVVDDEPDSRLLLARLLEERNATVITASSAEEALVAIREQKPSVLLSDIGMPDADGYSLIGRVRSLPADQGGNLPAAALTAFARSEDRSRALGAGFQIHLAKPIEPAELLAAVANLAGRAAEAEWHAAAMANPAV